MKLSNLAAIALLASVEAAPLDSRAVYESDALTAQGLVNLGTYVAKNGYPDAQKCTLKNTAVRREW